jgi:predicted nucleic acid-binding protein
VETIEQTLGRMQGQRVYFDTNILIYVLENAAGYSEACLPFFSAVAQQDIVGCTGEMTLAELLVQPMRSNDMIRMGQIRALFDDGYFEVFAHHRPSLELAAHIRATQGLKMIDAIHTASAIHGGCKYFITHDKQMQRQVSGIEVVNIGGWLVPPLQTR